MALSDDLADAAVGRAIDLARFDAGIRSRVIALLEDLERDAVAKLTARTLTDYQQARLNALLAEIRAAIDGYYERISTLTAAELQELAGLESAWQTTTLNTAAGFDLAKPLADPATLARLADATLIQGAPSREWWAAQSASTADQFTRAVRLGVGQGSTNAAIVADVRRNMDVSRRNAEALVRTSVQTVAAAARDDTLQANADILVGRQQISTLDGRTTDICMAYSGGVWDMEGQPIRGTKLPWKGGPPRHWNCRSTVIPVVKSFADLGIDLPELPPASVRSSIDGEVAADLKFDDWLARRSKAQQDEMLGKGRADLWRDGKITLAQLLDQRGNPLTLEQLRAKYGSPEGGR